MPFQRVAIYGLGLIGGSLAAGIQKTCPGTEIYGIARRQETLEEAKKRGWIHKACTDIAELPTDVDLVITCTPISLIAEHVKTILNHVSSQTLVTDIASTKSFLLEDSTLANDPRYVPGHPMGGSEFTGIEYASPTLLCGVPFILVEKALSNSAEAETHKNNVDALKKWLSLCRFQVLVMSAAEHDMLIGYVSHLPYLMATSLSSLFQNFNDDEKEKIAKIFGPGFRDTSRVASSSPAWGQDVCDTNKKAMLQLIDQAKQKLDQLSSLINAQDSQQLAQFFEQAKTSREQIIDSKHP